MFNVSLPFLNGIVSAYPVPFYFLVSPRTPPAASQDVSPTWTARHASVVHE